jgi:hypothetical protein
MRALKITPTITDVKYSKGKLEAKDIKKKAAHHIPCTKHAELHCVCDGHFFIFREVCGNFEVDFD